MIDYLTHYYMKGTPPFRSLSSLPEAQALALMVSLADDTPYGERFKDPAWYWRARHETEAWVRQGFIDKGGQPRSPYPIYAVLGFSPWLDQAQVPGGTCRLRIPLNCFAEGDLSFTYPDSMISLWFSRDQPPAYYRPDLHGHIFTRAEILAIVATCGLPEQGWEPQLPPHLAPYIEAQVWNIAPLRAYLEDGEEDPHPPTPSPKNEEHIF